MKVKIVVSDLNDVCKRKLWTLKKYKNSKGVYDYYLFEDGVEIPCVLFFKQKWEPVFENLEKNWNILLKDAYYEFGINQYTFFMIEAVIDDYELTKK